MSDLSTRIANARELITQEDGEYDLRALVKSGEIFKVHDYNKMGNRLIGTYPCGSVRFEETPVVLYRAAYLFASSGPLVFDDMYKGSLLTIVSPDYKLVGSIEFFKYELALYFDAAKEHIDGTRQHCVQAGAPGADNGIHFIGDLPTQWFGLLEALLKRKWMVYGGNDFEV